MKTNEANSLDLNLITTRTDRAPQGELKDSELEAVAAGKELGQFIPRMGGMSFPSISIPSFGT
jgi:hypothetical protein